MKLEFNNFFIATGLKTALAYGVAYAGRSYFQINPVHAALFACATLISRELGIKLSNSMKDDLGYSTFSSRAILVGSNYIPFTFSIATSRFTPLQAITTIFITTMTSGIYYIPTQY